jgi:polysaccharide deacetylase 2 family uncharacterized protein YibQ
MRRDELKQPLHKRSLTQRLWGKRPGALTCAYALAITGLVGGGILLAKQPMPFAGEPIVLVAMAPPEEIKTAAIEPLPEAGPPIEEAVDDAPPEKATATVEPPVEQLTYQQDATIFVSPKQPLTKAPVAYVTEVNEVGSLPRIGNGKKPSDIYARTTSLNIIHSDAPKIVIILGGMGLNEKLTASAAKELPADITMAFAPYGNNLQAQVDKARSQGHEVLLQLPLEPVGYPANNPGPKTLLTDGTPAENQDSLYWHMSRFAGYTGIINYMGGRYLSSDAAVKPLLVEMRKRGLLFFEDGSLPLSATEEAGKSIQFPVRRAQTVIDTDPSADSITTALGLLEDEARTNGVAIGTGSGLDITIKTVSDWAKAAADRGIILIPASAAFKGRLG